MALATTAPRKRMEMDSPRIHLSLVPDRLPYLLAELAMVC